MNDEQKIAAVEDRLVRGIAELKILEESRPEIVRTRPFTELGLDSLSKAHLREFITEVFECDIPDAMLGFEIHTVRQCAEFICGDGAASTADGATVIAQRGADRSGGNDQ